MITWVVTTDGRKEFIEKTIPTWDQATGLVTHRVIIDDSGDTDYRQWLARTFPDWDVIPVGDERCGYSPAMQAIRQVGLQCGTEFIFHTEDDFMLNRPINLDDVATLLRDKQYLAQVALLRQPWFPNEIEAGGLIEALEPGEVFTECSDGDRYWIEHRAVWTANPNMFRRDVAKIEYPNVNYSESAFMRSLKEDANLRCAFWGKRSDEYYVHHIGEYRNGIEY